jgi:hypothetical protein
MDELVISVMCANEVDNIVATLKPCVDFGLKKYLVHDTGSADETVKVVQAYLKEAGVEFYIVQSKFIDFSRSRNPTLKAVQKFFPNAILNLFLDAEWYLVNIAELIAYCKAHLNDNVDFHGIYVRVGNKYGFRGRLFRIKGNGYYYGRVHEMAIGHFSNTVPQAFYAHYRPSAAGSKRSDERRKLRDINWLTQDYEEDKNPRWIFYMAQTYLDSDDMQNALKYYLIRGELMDEHKSLLYDPHERFMSYYKAGQIIEGKNWELAMKYYLRAYEIVPQRIESLVKIAQHYANRQTKYIFARQACMVNFNPSCLMVEREMYVYNRWDQCAIGAWGMGFFKEGYDAIMNCLSYRTDKVHLKENYELYVQKLGLPNEWAKITGIAKQETNVVATPQVILNRRPLSILNLILFNEDEEYIPFRTILSQYLLAKGIEHYFYCYRPNLKQDHVIDGNMLYIRGIESRLPGILTKTLKALEIFVNQKYDYIVRSNISTVVNFDALSANLLPGQLDYGGPLYYYGPLGDKYSLYKSHHFVSGICIVLSRKVVKMLVKDHQAILSYDIIDDVAIGIYLHKRQAKLRRGAIGNDLYSFDNNVFRSGIIAYRNHSGGNRMQDHKNMQMIVNHLINVHYDICN